MSLPQVVSREEWLAARQALLAKEKAATRARDALSTARRELPMVEITKDYAFTGPEGSARLLDLFAGRRQLIVGHVYVSRAPLAKLEDYKARKGWDFPWYSSFGSDFNYDFHVTIDEAVAPLDYNYRTRADFEELGLAHFFDPAQQPVEMPGLSVFLRDGDRIFHTYSSFARGAEWTGGSYAFLDLTPLGRQEAWEQPSGRADLERTATPDFAS